RQPGANPTQNTGLPSGVQVGTGVRVVGTQKQLTAGALQTTGESLDVPINRRGFFEIVMPDGSSAYTRDGQFHLSSDGEIVTASGHLLNPALTLPQGAQSITIGTDGVVSVKLFGQPDPVNIGNINLVDFV